MTHMVGCERAGNGLRARDANLPMHFTFPTRITAVHGPRRIIYRYNNNNNNNI